jgi:hypothetical protein
LYMAAANTDKLRKTKANFSTTLDGSITDSDATIACASLAGVPIGTAVMFTIDRVDSNGTATPSAMEGVIGVVSGNNITTAVRGVEGTAQAHSAGAVVEILWTADNVNDLVDWALEEHNQDGTHSDITADSIDVSGAITGDSIDVSGNAVIDGSLTVGGSLKSNITATVLSNNLDVSGVTNISLPNTSLTVNGLSGGVAGQIVFMYGAGTNTAITFTHANAGGTQQFLNPNGGSLLINRYYGGAIMYCTGTYWISMAVASDRKRSCRVTRSSTQSINTGGATSIEWNSESSDVFEMHDNSTNPEQIVLNVTGEYLVGCYVAVSDTEDAGGCVVQILQGGGAGVAVAGADIGSNGGYNRVSLSGLITATAGDYVRVRVDNYSGETKTIQTTSRFWVAQIN